LDALGRSTLKDALAIFLTLVFAWPAPGAGQGSVVSTAKRLYQQKRWEALVKKFPDSPTFSADIEYYRGMALARLKRWSEARQAFEEGRRKDPRDERFPLGLAGICFKQKRFGEAKADLRRALRLAPNDAYAKEFLATIFFLEHNLDAALEYWNQIGKPQIRNVKVDPRLKVDPGLLSRTFAFSPASVLRLNDLRTTRARLNQLGIFPEYRFSLAPAGSDGEPDAFDLQLNVVERSGWTGGEWQNLLASLRGLPYETVYPEAYNLGDSAINLTSIFRWDDQKRRAFVDFSSPLRGNPAWRYRIFVDARNESWDLSRTFHGTGAPLSDLNMRTAKAGGEIRSVVSGRWDWRMGGDFGWRDFGNFGAPDQAADPAFAGGDSVELRLGTDYLLMDRPERRFRLESSISSQLGKIFGHSPGRFYRLEGALTGIWFPLAQGDDYRISEQVHVGVAGGALPLDELFMLGLERDNDLPLRAHIGTFDGRKGNAPLGRRYFLSNWEIDKNIYSNGWFNVKLAPFLDTGKITDGAGPFGDRRWLWDTGAEAKVRVLGGVTVVLTYGKDLLSGRNTFYSSVFR
jgi:Tetratricopeptide repeat